jgi:hypothetical protein
MLENERVWDPADGVLVMAHGGTDEWNASVRDAVAPLESEFPTRIAFGMADPATLQEAIDQLEASGVRRIVVVRLFVSGESFRHQTEFLLGKRLDPPPSGSAFHGGAETLKPLEVSSVIELDDQGLIDGPEAAAILSERAKNLSREPDSEVVLMIGHGSGNEGANERILEGMATAARAVRRHGFADVGVATLREDWPEQRERAEPRIRAWVADHAADGKRVVVVPFRLSGFGPYAQVLKGLAYDADGRGFLPHPAISDWIRRRAYTVLYDRALADRVK